MPRLHHCPGFGADFTGRRRPVIEGKRLSASWVLERLLELGERLCADAPSEVISQGNIMLPDEAPTALAVIMVSALAALRASGPL